MPEEENECLVEQNFLLANNKKIGDKITLDVEMQTNDDGEDVEYLKQKELTIVGTVQSPLYVSTDRGTSDLGAGKVNYYIYVPEENINTKDIYTNIYMTVKDAKEYKTSSNNYEDYIEEVEDSIEGIKEERENARQKTLIDKAQEKVDEAEEELNTEKADAEKQIADAEKEIEDGKKEIEDAEKEISENKKKADKEFKDAEEEIKNAKNTVNKSEEKLKTKEEEANKTFENLEKQKEELQTNLNTVNVGLEEINTQYNNIVKLLENPELTATEKAMYEAQKTALETKKKELEETKTQLQAGIKEIDDGIETGKQEIENGKKEIENAKKEIEKNEETLKKTKNTTYAQIEDAEEEVAEAKEELANGEKELNDSKAEFEEKIAEAEEKLTDAKEKIADIEKPTWYILDRNENAGYVSFIQDTDSIENLGRVFPVVFFVVAALISLTSMTRMVEEHRMQIGTLKALGYNKFHIMLKYVIYAALACVIGGILGMSVGFVLIPKVIWLMYDITYEITDISLSFNFAYGGLGLILISLCIIGATIYTILRALRHEPATLMRPKAPKSGNRVMLEKIPFIWKRLNFIQKVTVRNIFRYKKRFFMTIIGILGCTALILTGFGLKDSVTQIVPKQFGEIFVYDMQITLKDTLTEEQEKEFIEYLNQKEEVEKLANLYMTSGTVINQDLSEDVQIVVAEDLNNLEGLINIYDIETEEKASLAENEIGLTDKACELLNVTVGSTIILRNSDDEEFEVKISNIIEDYVQHYVFITKATYENIFNKTYDDNVVLIRNVELTEEESDALATELMDRNEVASVTNMTSFAEDIEETLKLLNYVVLVLIVSAGLLAFVVLYNLANVNISERVRELATIKVLGFYDREVYDYVARETIILTIIGILLGLGFGFFLTNFILGTCEINMLRFPKIIHVASYFYSALITIAFTIIVNIATYFALKKIDMIESLKSIE